MNTGSAAYCSSVPFNVQSARRSKRNTLTKVFGRFSSLNDESVSARMLASSNTMRTRKGLVPANEEVDEDDGINGNAEMGVAAALEFSDSGGGASIDAESLTTSKDETGVGTAACDAARAFRHTRNQKSSYIA
jgi:hypothetical protein